MSWTESLELRRSQTHPDDGYYLSNQVSHPLTSLWKLVHFKFSFIYVLLGSLSIHPAERTNERPTDRQARFNVCLPACSIIQKADQSIELMN